MAETTVNLTETHPAVNAQRHLERTVGVLQNGEKPFVQSGGNLHYDRDLAGVPFIITSSLNIHTVQGGKFGPKEVAEFLARSVDPETDQTSDALHVQLSGRYILNQLRRMTEHELHGYVYTLEPNSEMPKTPSGSYPLMLRYWEPEEAEMSGVADFSDYDDEWPEAPAPSKTSKVSPMRPTRPIAPPPTKIPPMSEKRGRGRPRKNP